jgi:hypothetical protein
MDCLPKKITIPLGGLAGVDTDADFNSALRVGGVVLAYRMLDGRGGMDRGQIGWEGYEEPITKGLAYSAAERRNLMLQYRCL